MSLTQSRHIANIVLEVAQRLQELREDTGLPASRAPQRKKEFGFKLDFKPLMHESLASLKPTRSLTRTRTVDRMCSRSSEPATSAPSETISLPPSHLAGESLSATWLKEQCQHHFGSGGGALSPQDLCVAIFELLSSPAGDELLQNDLFELVGFDKFEFIQELLQRRGQIVASVVDNLAL